MRHPLPQIIDSHHHLWRRRDIVPEGILGAPYLARDFLWGDLVEAWAGLPVTRTAFVQVRSDVEEVAFVESVAASEPTLGAMIAWAPLERPELPLVLEGLRARPLVRGIRRSTQNEPDPEFCARPGYVRGVRELGEAGLLCEICVRHEQLAAAVTLARACPETMIVLEHLGKPDVSAAPPAYWLRGVEELASLPNVFCKISPVVHRPEDRPYQPETLAPFVLHAVTAFGWDRVLFGSNWPVSQAVVGYRAWVELLLDVLGDPGASRLQALFALNAGHLYRLG
jgi:L-fuconolactonase